MELCAGTMSRVGVTDVWFPPSSQSVAPQGYLPGMLYDLKTPYGNEDELKSTIDTLHNHGIACIADVAARFQRSPCRFNNHGFIGTLLGDCGRCIA